MEKKERICNIRIGKWFKNWESEAKNIHLFTYQHVFFSSDKRETKSGVAKEKEIRMDGRNGVAPAEKHLKTPTKYNPIQHLTYSVINTKQQNMKQIAGDK